MYDITRLKTVEEVKTKREKILRIKDVDDVPIVVIGNKCDLEDKRQVGSEVGENLSQEWNVPFFETSAKDQICNIECFYQVVREIRRRTDTETVEKKEPINCGCVLL